MLASKWFDDESQAEGLQLEFLQQLRECFIQWNLQGVLPEHTCAWPWPADESRLLVEVDVSGLTCGPWTLRVLYAPDNAKHPLLESEWGNEYLFDGPTGDADFHVSGIQVPPDQAAAWTASWLREQLTRPVVRRDWDRPASGTARLLPPHSAQLAVVEWRFGDDKDLLETTSGLVWSWLTKSPPSREIQERPKVAAAS